MMVMERNLAMFLELSSFVDALQILIYPFSVILYAILKRMKG